MRILIAKDRADFDAVPASYGSTYVDVFPILLDDMSHYADLPNGLIIDGGVFATDTARGHDMFHSVVHVLDIISRKLPAVRKPVVVERVL